MSIRSNGLSLEIFSFQNWINPAPWTEKLIRTQTYFGDHISRYSISDTDCVWPRYTKNMFSLNVII